jgi:uncharacterized membrane protein YhaH (DUF805 family)
MDWQNLFLSPDGRIRRQDFWIGWLILFAVNLVFGFVPLLGLLVHLFALYVGVCLYAKRLHDMGRTGWLQIAPFVIGFVLLIIGFALFGSALFSAAMAMRNTAPGPGAMAFLLGSLGGFLVVLSLAGMVHLAFLIWVGATPGQLGDNAYGPDPLSANTVDVF